MAAVFNEDIFNEKYNKYSAAVYKTAYQYLLDVHLAQDITQDVFIKLFTAKRVFHDSEHEKNWLLRVTINMCKNVLRSKAYHNLQLNDNIELYDNSFEKKSEDGLDMFAELKKLSPRQRTAVYLYYYEGYAVKDISALMGEKENTVKSHLSRARQKLKSMIEKE